MFILDLEVYKTLKEKGVYIPTDDLFVVETIKDDQRIYGQRIYTYNKCSKELEIWKEETTIK